MTKLQPSRRLALKGAGAALLASAATTFVATPATAALDWTVNRHITRGGVEFGVLGKLPRTPKPILLTLATDIGTSLQPYYTQAGIYLRKLGYYCVTIDLPSHGSQIADPDDSGLRGWAWRARNGSNFVDEFNARLIEVVDHLIEHGYAKPGAIVSTGTSRGGFLAFHYAAFDSRVRAGVGYAPVIDLLRLTEFAGMDDVPVVHEMNLLNHVAEHVGSPRYVVIGDRDTRVGTDASIAFCRALSERAADADVPSQVALEVLSEPRGHTVPPGGQLHAAAWILKTVEGIADDAAFLRALGRLGKGA